MIIRNEKLAAVTAIGLLSAIAIHFDYVRQNKIGREGYLTGELLRYDKYIAHPHLSIADVVITIFVIALFLGLYEALVTVFSQMPKHFGE